VVLEKKNFGKILEKIVKAKCVSLLVLPGRSAARYARLHSIAGARPHRQGWRNAQPLKSVDARAAGVSGELIRTNQFSGR